MGQEWVQQYSEQPDDGDGRARGVGRRSRSMDFRKGSGAGFRKEHGSWGQHWLAMAKSWRSSESTSLRCLTGG